MTCTGIVLAAGRSARMGQQKLSMPLGGKAILRWVLDSLLDSGLDEVICVVSAESEDLMNWAREARARVVIHPDPDRGRTSSIKVGLKAMDPRTRTMVLCLGDMPFVQSSTVHAVLEAASRTMMGMVVACYRGKKGHPVAWDQRYFQDILALADDEPLYHLTRQGAFRLHLDDPGVLININTPQEYEQACARIREGKVFKERP